MRRWTQIALAAAIVSLVQLAGTSGASAQTAKTMRENLVSLLDPKLRPFLWLRHVFTPPTFPYSDTSGYTALNPGFFHIPVHGQMIGDKIELDMLPAQQDFSDVFRGKVLYIFITPTLTPPYVQWFNMPIQNADFVLTRSMGATSHWQVTLSEKTMVLNREFTRTYDDPAGGFHITWKTDVKACNPGCLDTVPGTHITAGSMKSVVGRGAN